MFSLPGLKEWFARVLRAVAAGGRWWGVLCDSAGASRRSCGSRRALLTQKLNERDVGVRKRRDDTHRCLMGDGNLARKPVIMILERSDHWRPVGFISFMVGVIGYARACAGCNERKMVSHDLPISFTLHCERVGSSSGVMPLHG